MTARLEVEALTRVLGARSVVRDVSLTLEAGEIVCLLGPSGCGKSTTLRTIAGIERADRGTVTINGRVVADRKVHLPPESRQIGVMFQYFALFPHLTVAQNVGFGVPPDGRIQRVREALERVDMSGFADVFPHELSGGEQQRVALARAMAPRPKVMLMDEPFSGLNERLRDEVRDATLTILREDGAAVVLVTHEPDEALLMADRIALMREGKIMQTGKPHEIYDTPIDLETASFFSQINVLKGTVENGMAKTALGDVPALGHGDGRSVDVAIRPHHLRFDPEGTLAEIVRISYLGHTYRVTCELKPDGQRFTLTVPQAPRAKCGDQIGVSISDGRGMVF